MGTSGHVLAARGACLTDFTQEALTVPQLQARDVPGIIGELSQALQREACVSDALPFYHAVLNREFLVSTAMDCGLAFPHARLNGLKQLWFALGRTAEPVIWGVKGGLPVRLIFLMAVPATDATTYLHLLSALSRLGKEHQFLDQLCAAQDAGAMFAVLKQVKLRKHPAGGP